VTAASCNQVRQKGLANVDRPKVINVHRPVEDLRLQCFGIAWTGNAGAVDDQIRQAEIGLELSESLMQSRFIGNICRKCTQLLAWAPALMFDLGDGCV